MEAHYRPQPAEQDNTGHKIQDGDTTTGPYSHQPRRLDGLYRLEGCILSGPYTQEVQKIPEICMGRHRLPVPGPMFWSMHSTPGVHQSDVKCSHPMPQTRDTTPPLPRRLADRCRIVPGSVQSQGLDLTTDRTPGAACQLGEVGPHTLTAHSVLRDGNRHQVRPGISIRTESPEVDRVSPSLPRIRQPASTRVATSHRPPCVLGKVGALGPCPFEINPVPTTDELDSIQGQQVQASPYLCRRPPRPDLVGGPSTSADRSTSTTASCRSTTIHRCVHSRLGSTSTPVRGVRTLVPRGVLSTHQLPGTPSSEVGPRGIPGILPREDSPGDVRQCHRSVKHQETRGYQVMGSVFSNPGTVVLGQRTQDLTAVQVHTRPKERPSRPVEQEKTDPTGRVVPTPRDMQGHVEVMGSPACGPVCHKQEPPAAAVLLPHTRSKRLVNRCSSHSVGQPVGLRLSTTSSVTPSHNQAESIEPVLPGPSGTQVAPATLVRRPITSSGRHPKRTATVAKSTKTASYRPLPSESRNVQPSRLEAVQSALRERGFSEKAAARISKPHRRSTTNLYQAKWAQYCGWCRTRSVDPLRATIPVIVDFLIFLREQKNLSSTAIKGYRAALAPVFLHRGLDISTSREISDLFKNFDQEIVRTVAPAPKWDLNVVLQSLTRPPYEPISSCSLKRLTYKTVFLLSLASAKRVSEIHGLSYVVSWSEDKSSATLRLCPDFIAKTQIPGDPATRYEPIVIPALTPLVDHTDTEFLLCPLRSLQTYLLKTAAARPKCPRLFMSTVSTIRHRSISKNTISFWIRTVIKEAYKEVPQSDLQLWKISAHEVRAVATSLLFRQNASIRDVMNAASWRSRSTFVSCYLRDLSHQYLDVYSLGPFVAAQAVIQETRTTTPTQTVGTLKKPGGRKRK